MDLGLQGRVAVIMGGSSGIGLATARRLLQEGAQVAVCGRGEERLKDALATFHELGYGHHAMAAICDVSIGANVTQFIESVVDRFGKLDILVNCAGGSLMKRFFDLSMDDWQQQISLKYFAIVHAVLAATPHLKNSDAGRIINVNSTLSREASPKLISTAASRAGLLNLSKSLSVELAPYGILVNSVSMGIIRSGQWERRRVAANVDATQFYGELAASRDIPLGRVGEPEEAADVITFLASRRSSFVTGTCVEVDGGMSRTV